MAEYNGVWVFAEQRSGELQKVSLEILGEGRRLANELGVKLTAVLLGNNVGALADTLGEHGADEVLVAEHPELDKYTTDGYTKVICDLVNERKPGILFIGCLLYTSVIGGEVILTALKNITNGEIFDENFLMSIATIGAFFIGEYPEAVAVMLFYQIGEVFHCLLYTSIKIVTGIEINSFVIEIFFPFTLDK